MASRLEKALTDALTREIQGEPVTDIYKPEGLALFARDAVLALITDEDAFVVMVREVRQQKVLRTSIEQQQAAVVEALVTWLEGEA